MFFGLLPNMITRLPWRLSGKESACKCRFDPWLRNIPWRRAWRPILVFLPGEHHRQRSLVGYSPWGCKESDTTERLHFTKNGAGSLGSSTFLEGYKQGPLIEGLTPWRRSQCTGYGEDPAICLPQAPYLIALTCPALYLITAVTHISPAS